MPAQVIERSLDDVADRMIVEGVEPDDLIKILDAQLRREVARRVGGMFLAANALVVVLIATCFGFDTYLVLSHPNPPARLVDQSVLQTLLGATTVQLGILMVGIVGYLFPRRPMPAKPPDDRA